MQGMTLESYDALVRQIYAAGLDQAKWGEFLASLSDTLGHACIALHSHDLAENANTGFLTHNYGEEYQASYRAYYAGTNPWNERVAAMPIGRAIASPAILAPELLRKTEFYNDWIRPQEDVGTGAGITLHRDRNRFLRLSANIRFRDLDTMQELLVELLDRLGKHMQLSFELSRQVAGRRIGHPYEEALESVPGAVFLLDASGRLCHANANAEALRQSGNYVRVDRDRRVVFLDAHANLMLDRALGAIVESGARAATGLMRVSGAHPSIPLDAVFAPFVTEDRLTLGPLRILVDDGPALVVTLRKPEPFDAGYARLVEAYGLTIAEIALVRHIFQDEGSVSSFAERRNVSVHTARNQMRSVMSKTGMSRQTALVALVGRTIGAFPTERGLALRPRPLRYNAARIGSAA
ncbi:MAG: hypothetical protein ABIY37_12570 [Devosia sp.]